MNNGEGQGVVRGDGTLPAPDKQPWRTGRLYHRLNFRCFNNGRLERGGGLEGHSYCGLVFAARIFHSHRRPVAGLQRDVAELDPLILALLQPEFLDVREVVGGD